MTDWTTLEHDREKHGNKSLRETGFAKGCPRCELLMGDGDEESYLQKVIAERDKLQAERDAALKKLETAKAALEEILKFWKGTDTPKPYFYLDTCNEALRSIAGAGEE